MKRLNLRDVPDDVYEALSDAAEASSQSLNASLVGRLREIADLVKMGAYVDSYLPPQTNISLEDATAAVREVRDAS